MSKGSFLLKFLIVPATFLILAAAAFSSDDAPRIKPEQLKERLGQPGMQLLDVRIASDWKKSDLKIVGAEHVDPHDVSAWAKAIQKDSFVVAYCSWDNEYTSASVVLKLMELGYSDVYALAGGWNEWVRLGYPTEKK